METSDYYNKYVKYKTKYKSSKRENNITVTIDQLVIYQNNSLITTQVLSSNHIILNGYIEDSVVYFANGTPSESVIISSTDTLSHKLSSNDDAVIINEDGSKFSGTLDNIDGKNISVIDDYGKLLLVKKWKYAEMPNTRHQHPLLLVKEPGTLNYLVDSISWNPVYNLYVDSEKLEYLSQGTLYFMASINNMTGSNISINKTHLVSGNFKTESSRSPMYSAQKKEYSSVAMMKQTSVEQTPFSELLIFPLNEPMILRGEKYIIPIADYKLDMSKIYTIDCPNYGVENKNYIESQYGYKIKIIDNDLPEGILKIFTNSDIFKTTLFLGSVRITRTPKNTDLEISMGKTSRIRAIISKEESVSDMESKTSINRIKKYRITTVKITGIIINSTEQDQDIILREWIGNSTLVSVTPKVQKKMDKLEWIFYAKTGESDVNIEYQIYN